MAEVGRARTGRVPDEVEPGEAGFTLIELLIVLLVIGILLTIAIPTFLSVTNTANDTGAQSNLDTALVGARTYYLRNQQSYTGIYENFGSVDTGISDVASSTGSSGPHVVSVDPVSGSVLVMTAYGPGTPDCWGLLDLTEDQTTAVLGQTQVGVLYFEVKNITTSACQADNFTSATAVGPAGSTLLKSKSGFSNVG